MRPIERTRNLLILVTLSLTPAAWAGDGLAGELQAYLDGLCGEGGVPGASAALVLPDGTLVARAAGHADPREGTALEVTHRFLSGSTGKTYVGAWALALAAEGGVDLDAPVTGAFEAPEWFGRVANHDVFTLRQLLRHRSGVAEYYLQPAFLPDLAEDWLQEWELEQQVGYVFDLEPLFAVDEGFSYADTNYLLAGIALEALSEKEFYAEVQRRFLGPLGLERTVPTDRRDLPDLAVGHVAEGSPFGPPRMVEDGVLVMNPAFEWCGGGFASTPSDLARWARALYSGAAFAEEHRDTIVEQLLDAEPSNLGRGQAYGVATQTFELDAGLLVGHQGFFPGYLTTLGWFPEHDIAVAFQTNTDDSRKLGKRLEALSAELLGLALKSQPDSSSPAPDPVGHERGDDE